MNLRLVLLGLLSKGPNTGYGLDRSLRTENSHLWRATLQRIYGELANMEAAGLVDVELIEQSNRPVQKKVYSLTKLGSECLDDALSSGLSPLDVKDELLVRLMCLERIPAEQLLKRLEEHVGELEQQERSLTAKTFETSGKDVGRLLSLEMARRQVRDRITACKRMMATVSEPEVVQRVANL